MTEILFNVINTTYTPFVEMGPLYAIAAVSITISLILALAYKFLANQNKIKYARTELKELKTKMDAAKKKGNQKEMQKLFEKSLELNNQQLMLNMKPLLASMVLIALFLPWLAYAYGDVNAPVADNKGAYIYDKTNESFTITQNSEPTITFDNTALKPAKNGDEIQIGGMTRKVIIEQSDNKVTAVKFDGYIANLPFSLPIFGNTVGWLGLYIIISMPATFLFRKMLNVD